MSNQSFFVLAMALLLQLCACQDPAVTCQAQNPLDPATAESGFKICVLNKTDNVVTNAIGFVANLVGHNAKAAYRAGKCYCKQNCNPSQLVCENFSAFAAYFPGLDMNLSNGVIELAYLGVNWHVFCYCPDLVEEGVDPCVRPPKPDFCKPYPGSL